MMLQKNLKGKWIVMYGIGVSIPYGINEGDVATYGFVLPTHREGKTIREKRKWFLTEQGNSIQSPRVVFNGSYNRKIRKRSYLYKK